MIADVCTHILLRKAACRTLPNLPNLPCLTDHELRELAATADRFADAAAYVLKLRREIAGLCYRLPEPTCATLRGELRCDLAMAHDGQHFDSVERCYFFVASTQGGD